MYACPIASWFDFCTFKVARLRVWPLFLGILCWGDFMAWASTYGLCDIWLQLLVLCILVLSQQTTLPSSWWFTQLTLFILDKHFTQTMLVLGQEPNLTSLFLDSFFLLEDDVLFQLIEVVLPLYLALDDGTFQGLYHLVIQQSLSW